jgi:predicted SAM-dependent methyltransferase
MRKLNLGCGGNILAGWENHDADVDIRNPLPYEDESIDFIFIEHCVEHVTTPDAVRFFAECLRILKPDGVLRVAVPCADKIRKEADEAYMDWFGCSGFGIKTRHSAVQSILLNHGHLSAWNYDLLETCLYAGGFREDLIYNVKIGESVEPELNGLEGHGKVIGGHNNEIETIVMEAVK